MEAENVFMSRELSEEATDRVHDLKCEANGLVNIIEKNCPEGRERDLAIIRLEESLMWATKAISREQS